jgi:hypothetical protein
MMQAGCTRKEHLAVVVVAASLTFDYADVKGHEVLAFLKRGWTGSKQCMFCASDESIDHLFFACLLARIQCSFDSPKQPHRMFEVNIWLNKIEGSRRLLAKNILAAAFWALWKTRNKVCFDNIMPTDSCGVIYMICQYIDYWSNLEQFAETRNQKGAGPRN